jgi:hypothetical protein
MFPLAVTAGARTGEATRVCRSPPSLTEGGGDVRVAAARAHAGTHRPHDAAPAYACEKSVDLGGRHPIIRPMKHGGTCLVMFELTTATIPKKSGATISRRRPGSSFLRHLAATGAQPPARRDARAAHARQPCARPRGRGAQASGASPALKSAIWVSLRCAANEKALLADARPCARLHRPASHERSPSRGQEGAPQAGRARAGPGRCHRACLTDVRAAA